MAKPTFTCSAPPSKYVLPEIETGTLDYSTTDCTKKESAYMESLMVESVNIAGGPLNIFPLLGIHNQGSVIDLTGAGYPLSSGTPANSNVLSAFSADPTLWTSQYTGLDVVTKPAWLGYCFGSRKNAAGAERNNPPAPVRNLITTIELKQGPASINRARQLRVENSDDGVTWKTVDLVNVQDVPDLVTIAVKQSWAANYWRIVPTMFNGVSANVPWVVDQLRLLDQTQTSIDTIQDFLLMENRDRDYSTTSICMKAVYDLIDVQTELTKFGIDLPQQYIFTIPFASMIKQLGRPIVVGDIIELPAEVQYDHNLNAVQKFLEVSDTTWSNDGHTLDWRPKLFRVTASPLISSQENRSLIGNPSTIFTAGSLEDIFISQNVNTQPQTVTNNILADASTAVPETGSDTGDVQSGTNMYGDPGSYDGRDQYVEDGIPPDNLPYTEGIQDNGFPANPKDGDYHRMNYKSEFGIPPRLYQFNARKGRWVFMEADRRGKYSSFKPSMLRLMESSSKLNLDGSKEK